MMKAYQFTEEQQKAILHAYVDEGLGLRECAKIAGTRSYGPIRNFLVKQGVEIRPYALNRKRVDQEKVKDKTYFSKENESPNMAWLLGFLASDGCIARKTNGIKISLADRDREILERIKEELNLTDSHVKDRITCDGYGVCDLFWTCAQHKKDLARYGIVPNKTFVLTPPYDLNPKFYLDYIRGYFDGDGSICEKSNKTKSFSMCSATKEILDFIIKTFEDYGIPPVKIHTTQRVHTIYEFAYCRKSSVEAIYKLLYFTSSTMFLKRKKNKFIELFGYDINSQETVHLPVEDEKIC